MSVYRLNYRYIENPEDCRQKEEADEATRSLREKVANFTNAMKVIDSDGGHYHLAERFQTVMQQVLT